MVTFIDFMEFHPTPTLHASPEKQLFQAVYTTVSAKALQSLIRVTTALGSTTAMGSKCISCNRLWADWDAISVIAVNTLTAVSAGGWRFLGVS